MPCYAPRVTGSPPSRRSFPWRAAALAVVGVLGVGVLMSVWPRARTDGTALPTGPAGPCPHGLVESLGRAARVVAALRATDEGARWLRRLGQTEVRLCFGAVDVPVVTEDRALLLDARTDDAECAARVGHLVAHVVEGMPMPARIEADADCPALVDRALVAEAEAYAVELRLRRALGLTEPRYEFEADFHASPQQGEATILAYLRAHPEGGPGLDGLGAAYAQRCAMAAGDRASARAESTYP